ncbi:MAG TPA: hypothetical protein VG820_13040, partial [Fimbriimonadaceae bacterium]|nr:hypothetical protein [Fimbriimonadaceae bacterium]
MGKRISPQSFSDPISLMEFDGRLLRTYECCANICFKMDPSRESNLRDRAISEECPLCGGAWREVYSEKYRADMFVAMAIHECRNCGNWIGRFGTSITPDEFMMPFLREFDPQHEIPALTQLVEEAKRRPRLLHALSPKDFEVFVGSVLQSFFQCDVHHVGQSHDGGIDLI